MKSQIALLGIGLVIASGVGYVELKPVSKTPAITAVATPDRTTSTTSIPDSSNTQTMIATPEKSSLPKISNPTIPRPTISGGGGDDEGDEDGDDEGEYEDDEGNESDDD